jgi:hypothetical protein
LRWKYAGCAFPVALSALISTPAPAANPTVAIQGNWVSDCLPLGQNGRHGLVIRITVTSDSFDASGRMFAHNVCDAPVFDFVDHAELGRTEPAAGGWDLRLTLMSATMTIKDKSVAALYAQRSKCGLATWQVDVPMPVEGRMCEPISFPSKGAILIAKARTTEDRLTIQDLAVLFGAGPTDGVVLPQDVEFRRE